MANIADLFRAVSPQQPSTESELFGNRIGQLSEGIDPQGATRGAAIVLRSLLEQLQSLPSSAPEGVQPRPDLDAFLFNSDPRGEFGPATQRNRALSSKFFGELL